MNVVVHMYKSILRLILVTAFALNAPRNITLISIQIDKDILHNTYLCDCVHQSEYSAGGEYFIR